MHSWLVYHNVDSVHWLCTFSNYDTRQSSLCKRAKLTGFFVASLQLLLIETRSRPLYIVAPAHRGTCSVVQPVQRASLCEHTHLGTLIVSAIFGAGGGAVLSLHYGTIAYSVCVYTTVTVSFGLRYTCGEKWLLPGTLMSSLYSVVVFSFYTYTNNRIIDVIAIWTTYFITLSLVSLVAPSVYDCTVPPTPRLDGDMPQLNAGTCSATGIAKVLDFPLCPTSNVYDKALKWTVPFFNKVDSNCPLKFVGIWWMEHNTFPMELITVHRRRWSTRTSALFWNGRDITFHTSFSGRFAVSFRKFNIYTHDCGRRPLDTDSSHKLV